MFDTKLREYRFKERINANLFVSDLKGKGLSFSSLKIRKGLPQYRGQVETGWSVFTRTRSIADELEVSKTFSYIADSLKMTNV